MARPTPFHLTPVRRALRLAAALLLGLAAPAGAEEGEVCDPGADTGPVSLIILANGAKVQQLAATVKDTKMVVRDAKTVIFADGRVITADVASAGEHLNKLGWGGRRIDIAVTLPAKRPRLRSSYG
ncbi:MAG: hypothetical protein MJE66_21095 [Proteobacteria bacterium]|nr:hypothetical protein [Pseudomonadota bacterium]